MGWNSSNAFHTDITNKKLKIPPGLKERCGYWITTDIYIKPHATVATFKMTDDLQPLPDRHNVNKNMFHSMESAAAFFAFEGFVIDKEAGTDYSQLDSYNLFTSASPEILGKMDNLPKCRRHGD